MLQMELMSPLFFCALIALLPQALGKSPGKFMLVGDFARNTIKNNKQINDTNDNTRINFNETSINKRVSDLQSVFMNPICKECHSCMEKAIKAHKVHSHMNKESKENDFPKEIDNLEENTTHRNKRNLEADSKLKPRKKIANKLKTKKNKNNKSYSVTKYSDGGKIFALKVNDAMTSILSGQLNITKAPVAECQVYKIKESFSCDSPDADFILTEKRNPSKIGSDHEKIDSETNLHTDRREKVSVPMFRKRHVVEESQISENFMPSIEEMY